MLGSFSTVPAILFKYQFFQRIELVSACYIVSVFADRTDKSKNYSLIAFFRHTFLLSLETLSEFHEF